MDRPWLPPVQSESKLGSQKQTLVTFLSRFVLADLARIILDYEPIGFTWRSSDIQPHSQLIIRSDRKTINRPRGCPLPSGSFSNNASTNETIWESGLFSYGIECTYDWSCGIIALGVHCGSTYHSMILRKRRLGFTIDIQNGVYLDLPSRYIRSASGISRLLMLFTIDLESGTIHLRIAEYDVPAPLCKDVKNLKDFRPFISICHRARDFECRLVEEREL